MAWYDEAVFYHIYPLGMLDAPKENDYTLKEHRLKELKKWMPHIKGAGFNAIYIGPLFESVGHGYETTDYRKLDSRLGDNEDLKQFVKDCHKEGIRVIFDGVFNHVGRDFFAFKDLQQYRENSRYKDWFLNVNFWGNNEYNDGFSYENWGGYNLLVKLNQRNQEVKDYIADVIRFWVNEFDVDGIRLDAADVLDFDYMKMLRWVANEVKPDFWLMGEVIHGDYTRWVNDGTLHSVTNYTLHKALYSGHNDHNYFEIAHTVKRLYEMGGNRPDGLKLYNFSDNHDVERIMTKLNNKANYAPVHILVYTLPGVPSIYYGSEFGIEGRKEKGSDASLRPALNYADFKNALKDNDCTKLIAKLAKARKAALPLSYGDYREVMLTNRQYVFTRTYEGQSVIVAVNNDENRAQVRGGGIIDGTYVGVLSGTKLMVSGGSFSADLEANSGEIFLPENMCAELDIEKAPVEIKPTPVKVAAPKVEEPKKEEPKVEEPKVEAPKKEEPKAESKTEVVTKTVIKAETAPKAETVAKAENSAAAKYGLAEKYAVIDANAISQRSDYDAMSIEELQVAILEKMAKNGPVNDQMIKTVMDNIYPDSLKNWVKSFR